jgi:hypothetical protein
MGVGEGKWAIKVPRKLLDDKSALGEVLQDASSRFGSHSICESKPGKLRQEKEGSPRLSQGLPNALFTY